MCETYSSCPRSFADVRHVVATSCTPAIQTAGSIVPDFWAEGGLNFNPEFFFLCLKAFSRIIFSILFTVPSRQNADQKNLPEFAFYAFISEFEIRTNQE